MAFRPSAKPPVTAAEIPPGWIEDVRGAIQREGRAVRAGSFDPIRIEVKSLETDEWHRLSYTFTTETERDIILEQLIGRGAAKAAGVV